LGGCGGVSGLSNILPSDVSAMCRAWVSGDTAEAAQMQLSFLPLIRALFAQVNPIPVKAVLASMGVCREEYRLPLCPLEDDEKAALLSVFRSAGAR
ncbi:MAG: dihydrodipicolinate synthase family protein, partial [Clostridia bacterium]|nr:dihydrodipicolinate synthase family protein [Clostridia bacterium]